MALPSSSSQGLFALLVFVTLSLVACATWWDQNQTMQETVSVETEQSIALPGLGWLTRIASPETVFEYKGVTYSSAYDAVMYGNPAEHACRNLNSYINSFIFSSQTAEWFITKLDNIEVAHYLLCYLRNLILGALVYYATGAFFHYHCYIHPRSKEIFKDRERPSPQIMWDQIKLAQASLFLYVMLPVLDEFFIEQGYTQVYFTVQEIGGIGWYLLTMFLYFSLVEIGIYWMHRTLHTNKFLYKHVHMLHHKYNSPETLTPWASIAFHPLDGILQASPYVACTFVVPCHYVTHVVLLFFTAVWATYIHDAMDLNMDPIMGSKYHTLHHTHYIYNYGQVFIFCDKFWGTYQNPPTPTGVAKRVKSKST